MLKSFETKDETTPKHLSVNDDDSTTTRPSTAMSGAINHQISQVTEYKARKNSKKDSSFSRSVN